MFYFTKSTDSDQKSVCNISWSTISKDVVFPALINTDTPNWEKRIKHDFCNKMDKQTIQKVNGFKKMSKTTPVVLTVDPGHNLSPKEYQIY